MIDMHHPDTPCALRMLLEGLPILMDDHTWTTPLNEARSRHGYSVGAHWKRNIHQQSPCEHPRIRRSITPNASCQSRHASTSLIELESLTGSFQSSDGVHRHLSSILVALCQRQGLSVGAKLPHLLKYTQVYDSIYSAHTIRAGILLELSEYTGVYTIHYCALACFVIGTSENIP